jgi:uncharacterized membrane protein YkoI
MQSRAPRHPARAKGGLKRLALALAIVGASMSPSRASEAGDHDRARQALEAGEILPLRTVLDKLVRDTPGQVMEVELERRDARWIYEIKLLRPGGALIKLWVDARDGALVSNREQGSKR